VNAIKHKLTISIEGILHARQTHLKGKEYLVEYMGSIIRRQCG
jgi:hypothetical protein